MSEFQILLLVGAALFALGGIVLIISDRHSFNP